MEQTPNITEMETVPAQTQPIGSEQVKKLTQILQKYKSGLRIWMLLCRMSSS